MLTCAYSYDLPHRYIILQVDKYSSKRQWIIVAQCILATCCLLASTVANNVGVTHTGVRDGSGGTQEEEGGSLAVTLGLIFLMNTAAATQDIAVDGPVHQTKPTQTKPKHYHVGISV